MTSLPSSGVCRLLLVRPRHLSPSRWDLVVQTLMQISDPTVVLSAVVDPHPSPNLQIVASMDGLPIVAQTDDLAEGVFTHVVLPEEAPDILDPGGKPWPRISFAVIALLAEQVAARNGLMAIFNRYRSFAQSLTNLIPLDGSFSYESLICQSLRHLLSANAAAYCEANLAMRTVTVLSSDPESLFAQSASFPLTEAIREVLLLRDRYFDDLDPDKTGILHLPHTGSRRVVVFKLQQEAGSTLPFLLIFPPPFPQENPLPESEFQNALELSAPVLETSHALFAHRSLLKRKSEHDPLTKILNRESLDAFIHQAWKDSHVRKTPLTLLMIDIDHFKRVNDTLGHQIGDEVIISVTEKISGTLRAKDGFGRYGGEEFVIVLPEIDKETGIRIAERILGAVRALSHPKAGAVTVSIGLANHPSDVSREEELIALADRMLYEAKRAGRNRVVAATP